MEDNLNFSEKEDNLWKLKTTLENAAKTIKSKKKGCGTASGNIVLGLINRIY